MNDKTFEIILKNRLKRIQKVLGSKAKEYSSGDDRLHNFKRAGAMLGQSPSKALVGMWAKHLISIFDIVDGVTPKAIMGPALINEKIGDAINYLILLEASLKDEMYHGKAEEFEFEDEQ